MTMRNYDTGVLRWALVFAVILLGAWSPASVAQEPGAAPECQLGERDCLSMGKRIVQFVPSQRYETVTLYDGPAPNAPRAARLPTLDVPGAVGTVVYVSSLEAAGVVLVELAEGVTPGDFARALGAILPPGVVGVVGAADRGSPVYSTGDADHVLINQLIVRFRVRTPDAVIAEALAGGTILKRPPQADYLRYVVEYPGLAGREVAALSSRLDQTDVVEYAQPNFVVVADELGAAAARLQAACPVQCPAPTTSSTTGDPLLAQQWYLDSPGSTAVDINATEAWQLTTGDADIVIAILDDAVEITHEDLVGKIHSTWNATYGDTDLRLQPWDRHGTAVAGLAAAATNNGIGIAGIGANVSLMPVRVWDKDQWGRMIAPHDRVTDAILKAAQTAQVLSASFTYGSTWFPDVEQAIDTVMAPPLNRVVVFAAGNEGNSVLNFPASMSGTLKNGQPRPLIAVGATDSSDAVKTKNPLDTTGCDWGSNTGVALSVVAPGVGAVTTDRTGTNGYCADTYAFINGTSAATPLVAGTAALLLSREPLLSPAQVKARLESTAIDLGPPGHDPASGWGRIDACRALLGGPCVLPLASEPSFFGVLEEPTELRVILGILVAFILLMLLMRLLRVLRRVPPPPKP
jgi:subtilisin family serine protease